jgi:hypothetical protein
MDSNHQADRYERNALPIELLPLPIYPTTNHLKMSYISFYRIGKI